MLPCSRPCVSNLAKSFLAATSGFRCLETSAFGGSHTPRCASSSLPRSLSPFLSYGHFPPPLHSRGFGNRAPIRACLRISYRVTYCWSLDLSQRWLLSGCARDRPHSVCTCVAASLSWMYLLRVLGPTTGASALPCVVRRCPERKRRDVHMLNRGRRARRCFDVFGVSLREFVLLGDW